MTTLKTNSKLFEREAFAYILDAINSDNYEANPRTDKEKLQFLWDTFKDEYGHEVERYGRGEAFKNWIGGLPSSFNVDFENYRILELAEQWKSLEPDADEKKQYQVLANWFNLITVKTFKLFERYEVDCG